MSPTVPPISTITTSASPFAVTARIASLISLVTCGNDLNRLAEIIAAPFFLDHLAINAAGGPVVRLRKVRVREAFVMPEVEIGFGAVVGDEDFAVLERRHRARIDVEVRIELDQRHVQPARFEQAADRRRRQAFAQTGNHATRYENVFRH